MHNAEITSLLERTRAPPKSTGPFFTPSTPVGADPPVDTPGGLEVLNDGFSYIVEHERLEDVEIGAHSAFHGSTLMV